MELLKQIAPKVKRVANLRTVVGSSGAQFAVLQAAAPLLGVDVIPINMRDTGQIERAVSDFARDPSGGMIVTAAVGADQRGLTIALAARHRLPAVYNSRNYVTEGGLICYGPDVLDLYRRSASYVDRILRGEKPADLPVQAPTKYQLVLNLKTAKSLGLDIPAYARVDEVIE